MNRQSKQHSTTLSSTFVQPTKGVETLLGEPKKAILKLSVPMIVGMFVITIYYVADAIWVSGLSAEALAAVGFVFPFFFMALAIAAGLGTGGGAAVSRRIGAQQKHEADDVAVHTLVIMIVLSAVLSIVFFIFAQDIFLFLGAGEATELSVIYARILSLGTIIIFFTFVGSDLLRSEGDAKRAMIGLGLGSGLNIILDPIFIYTFGFGIAGAAIATLLSMGIASLLLFYWLFLRKKTYLTFNFTKFRFKKAVIFDISQVGFPAFLQQMSMALMMLLMNFIIVGIGGTDGVAIFSAGWRIATVAIIPLLGIATAVVTVSGATFGAKEYTKLDKAFNYAVKLGIAIECCIALIAFILAPGLAALFTQAEGSGRLVDDLVLFLRMLCIYYPIVGFATFSSSLFQGTGKGANALIITAFRTIMLMPPLSVFFAEVLGYGLVGIWLGIIAANIIGPIIAFVWAKFYIHTLKKSSIQVNNKD